MNDFLTSALARRYLLGDVVDEERQQIESLFISDDEAKTRVLIAEEDLIEDYFEGNLTQSEREKFLLRFGDTPARKRRLRIESSIRKPASVGAKEPTPRIRSSNFLSVLRGWKPRILIPAIAAICLVLALGVIWLAKINSRKVEEVKRAEVERELTALNSAPRGSESPPGLITITLSPVNLRGVENQTQLNTSVEPRVIELHLLWIHTERYSSFRAVLRKLGDTQQYTISNLQLADGKRGSEISLRIPSQLLTKGLYQINLSGAGDSDLSEEYTFEVTDQ